MYDVRRTSYVLHIAQLPLKMENMKTSSHSIKYMQFHCSYWYCYLIHDSSLSLAHNMHRMQYIHERATKKLCVDFGGHQTLKIVDAKNTPTTHERVAD